MSRLRRALIHLVAVSAITTLAILGGATAQAAPPTTPSPPPPREAAATSEAAASGSGVSRFAVLSPTRAGVLDDELGLWVTADIDFSDLWTVVLFDSNNTFFLEDPLQQRQRDEIPLSFGGWYYMVLWNGTTGEQIDIGWYDVQAPIERLYGTSRFETSSSISQDSFPVGTPVAFVANAFNFPDALSGAAAAAVLGGPVLLTAAESLPERIKVELGGLKPGRIVVLGGPSVVSDAVAAELALYTAGTVERYAGTDRFETSAAISAAAFTDTGVPVTYIANGFNFPDALSGAAAGGTLGGPVLLSGPDALPEAIKAELNRLDPSKIVVLGGPSVISDAVMTALSPYSGNVVRLAGESRFETSAAISADTFPGASPDVPIAYVANAFNFPDALSGAAAAGSLGGPVLLSAPGGLSAAVAAELDRLNPARIVLLGGPDVVSNAVRNELLSLAAPVVQRTGGEYVSAAPLAGPDISNVSITANSLSVTVSFDYVIPAGWDRTPAYVGIYPGSPAEFPYGDVGVSGDWGLTEGWWPQVWLPAGVSSGHASQSFRVFDDGPLTVMIFGTELCDGCAGGTMFLAGRDFAALP